MQRFIPVHKFITVAALLTGAAQLIFVYNLIHSRFWGKPAPENPWEATSLESGALHLLHHRSTTSVADSPVVYHDPYQYGVEGSTGDHVMQASPEQIQTAHDEA